MASERRCPRCRLLPASQSENCETGFRSGITLLGTYVTLGKVAYARQTDPTGTEDVGCHYGNGVVVGEAVVTNVRVGVGGGGDGDGDGDGDVDDENV